MKRFIVVEKYNGFRFISGDVDTVGEARIMRDRKLRHIEMNHKKSRMGSNGKVLIFMSVGEDRAARTRGTYLKSWR